MAWKQTLRELWQKEKWYWLAAVVLGVLLSLLFAAHWTEGYADMIQKGIGGKVVRFHVLANSDSEADQTLKLAVRDRVLQEYGDLLETCTSKEETLAMQAARVSVLAISVIAAFIARDPNSSVFGIVSFAWAGFGAAFGPVVLTALFWRRSNKQGALAGMIVGGVMVFVWKYLIRPMGGIWGIYELLPAFLLALAAIIIVSLATQAPEQAVLEEYDAVTKELKNEK